MGGDRFAPGGPARGRLVYGDVVNQANALDGSGSDRAQTGARRRRRFERFPIHDGDVINAFEACGEEAFLGSFAFLLEVLATRGGIGNGEKGAVQLDGSGSRFLGQPRVSRGHRKAVRLPHGRAELQPDGQIQVANHFGDYATLLPVLFAEVRDVWEEDVKQLENDRGDANEVSRAMLSLPLPGHARRHDSGPTLIGWIHLSGGGQEKQIAPSLPGERGVSFFVARVGLEILGIVELSRVDEKANGHQPFGLGDFVFGGGSNQAEVSFVEVAHRGNQEDRRRATDCIADLIYRSNDLHGGHCSTQGIGRATRRALPSKGRVLRTISAFCRVIAVNMNAMQAVKVRWLIGFTCLVALFWAAAGTGFAQALGGADQVRGQFMTLVACTPETGFWEEYDTLLLEDNREIQLDFLPWARKPSLGSTVTVAGRWKTRDRFEVSWVVSEEPRMAGGNPTTGEQRVCVLLVNFQDDTTQNATVEGVRQRMFDPNNSADKWWREASFGKMWITGDVYGWYTLPINRGCDPSEWRRLAIQMADPDVYFPQYNRLFILVPTGGGCSWGGLGTLGMQTFQTDDGPWTTSTSWCRSEYYNTNTNTAIMITTHEGGHNLGQHHASSIAFNGEALGQFDNNGADGTTSEYGDRLDTLGNWNLGCYNARHKVTLNWWDPEHIVDVRRAGTYTLSPYLLNSPEPKALAVFRGRGQNTNRDEYLYLEWRQPIGYDQGINWRNGANYNGVLGHFHWNNGSTKTYLIDFSYQDNDFLDAVLRTGQTWLDNYTGLGVRVVGVENGRMVVEVSFSDTGNLTEPIGFQVTGGVRTSGGLSDLISSDDRYVVIEARRPTEAARPFAEMTVDTLSPFRNPPRLDLIVEAAATAPAIQVIEMWNYDTERWEEVSRRVATPSDSTVQVSVTSNTARFIQPGTRLVRARIGWYDNQIPLAFWQARVDRVIWNVYF